MSDLHLSGFGQRVRLNCKHCLSCRLSRDIENDFDKLLKKDDTYKITVDDLTDCVEKKMDQVDRLNQRLRRSLKRELSFAELITSE